MDLRSRALGSEGEIARLLQMEYIHINATGAAIDTFVQMIPQCDSERSMGRRCGVCAHTVNILLNKLRCDNE